MRIKLRPTPEYSAARRGLSLSARLALRFVEQAIAANPEEPGRSHFAYSVPVFPDIAVTVVENGDLIVAFHRVSPTLLSLDLLIDRKNPPDWYRVE